MQIWICEANLISLHPNVKSQLVDELQANIILDSHTQDNMPHGDTEIVMLSQLHHHDGAVQLQNINAQRMKFQMCEYHNKENLETKLAFEKIAQC